MAPSITIEFSHSKVGSLFVETGANLFSWGYRLNTQIYPTYAGEVVQVLSAYIDNLVIEGEVRNYAKMEEIYTWFIDYFQVATQGVTKPSYSEEPVRCLYAERGWDMLIRPISLPNLHYGRDVVVPSWKIEAAIIEVDPNLSELTVNVGQANSESWNSEFHKLTADIGYREANPFSDAHGVLTADERKLYSAELLNSSSAKTTEDLIQNYNNLLANYENGDFSQGILRAFGNTDASMPVTTTSNSTPNSTPDSSGSPPDSTDSTDTTDKSGTPDGSNNNSDSGDTPAPTDDDSPPRGTAQRNAKVGTVIAAGFPAVARGYETYILEPYVNWAAGQLVSRHNKDMIIVVNFKGKYVRTQAMPADPTRLGAGMGYIRG